LQKIGKTLGIASGFTAFCNPRVESPYISWLLMKESYNPPPFCHRGTTYLPGTLLLVFAQILT
jgi:hypothetical protein